MQYVKCLHQPNHNKSIIFIPIVVEMFDIIIMRIFHFKVVFLFLMIVFYGSQVPSSAAYSAVSAAQRSGCHYIINK